MDPIVSRMNVEVYIKQGCSLCDDALDDLRCRGVGFVTRDIRENLAWFTRWRYSVPVLVVDGVERLRLRWPPDELARVLVYA
jgi:glutaredoxin